jgi:hypothetical protein
MAPEIELSGLRLRWPRELFLEAAEGLEDDLWSTTQNLWLLGRAFDSADALTAGLEDGSAEILAFILSHIDEVPYIYERRELFSDRQGRSRDRLPPGYEWAVTKYDRMLRRYYDTGSLGEHLQPSCPDDYTDDGNPSEALLEIVGVEGLWPVGRAYEEHESDDLLFDVVEAFDELVVMPTARNHHGYGGCGWHYRNFNHQFGRRAYRFEVNRILGFAGVPYRIAESGEDAGRVVAAGSDDLAPLLLRAAERERAGDGIDVQHAVALYRSRGATAENKRSAIVALAGVLERHRNLLKEELLKADEGALFHIANGFDLRHRDMSQKVDYDPAFLDWIVYVYLASIELVEALVSRQSQ